MRSSRSRSAERTNYRAELLDTPTAAALYQAAPFDAVASDLAGATRCISGTPIACAREDDARAVVEPGELRGILARRRRHRDRLRPHPDFPGRRMPNSPARETGQGARRREAAAVGARRRSDQGRARRVGSQRDDRHRLAIRVGQTSQRGGGDAFQVWRTPLPTSA